MSAKEKSTPKDRKEGLAEQRQRRVPLGTHKTKQSIHGELITKGYVGRWVNDAKNRVAEALNGGYRFVESKKNTKIGSGSGDNNTDMGSRVSMLAGTSKNGTPIKAYLMEIKEEWYEEDQATKEQKNKVVDDAIRGGGVKGIDNAHTYGDVTYTTNS